MRKNFEGLSFADIERLKRRAIAAVMHILDSVEAKIQLIEDFEYVPVEEAKLASKIISGLTLVKKYLAAQAGFVKDARLKMSYNSEIVRTEQQIEKMVIVRDVPDERILPAIPHLKKFLSDIEERVAPRKARVA